MRSGRVASMCAYQFYAMKISKLPEAHHGKVPEHVGKEEEHDGRVDELIEERSTQGQSFVVAVAVGDHPHAEDGAPSEHETNCDEDIEGIHEELERCRQHDPDLVRHERNKQMRNMFKNMEGWKSGFDENI